MRKRSAYFKEKVYVSTTNFNALYFKLIKFIWRRYINYNLHMGVNKRSDVT